jgi:F-type H+-transporting ATPase subunit b
MFWNKVTAFLEAKRMAVDESLETATKAKENALQLEAQMKEEMSLAKEKIKKLLDDAERDGNQKREDIINEAKEEALRRMKALEEELATEKANMANQIKQEIIEIAFAAAEKIVNKEIDQDKYIDIIDEILKETI